MTKQIKRRDFVSGIAIGAGGLVLAGCTDDLPNNLTNELPSVSLPPSPGSYYPPTLTGMRGSHEGSYEVAHALSWRGEKPTDYQVLDEHYDLVVVGAGMSGLAAAHFYREKMGPDANVLILDNHDDFGGHAKRNEFHRDDRMMVSLGGAQNIESVTGYSDAATQLMNDIGLNEDFLNFMDASTSEDLALVGNFDANNGVALPGAGVHFMYAGNWNAVMFGGEGYEQVLESLGLALQWPDVDLVQGNPQALGLDKVTKLLGDPAQPSAIVWFLRLMVLAVEVRNGRILKIIRSK